MNLSVSLRLALFVAVVISLPAASQPDSLVFGFTPSHSAEQLAREDAYTASLRPDLMREWMRQMTARPHHMGSPQAEANARFIADLFRSWGYETEIETFHVLFPTPVTRELTQLRPLPFKASLEEVIVSTDSAADALRAEALPPYNAYSADGEATGPLVYVNRGIPEDYEELERRGIDVKDKIVIARYGGSWRGIKPKVAAEKGAIGCIIFNDPGDDGYAQGAAYPDGAFKHDSAVQRGSVMDLPSRAGDPLTPGHGSTKNARRLKRQNADTIMKIPVLPISSLDAEPLLRTLDGPVAPDSWRGALPVTYRLGGGGGTVVRLKVAFNWDIVPIHNVIARMPGSERPDQWVIRGNHHDAWVIGARDPMSGLVPMLEQARAYAELAKTGWRPKRTLVFCAWDGEEPGLLGSTEWAEHHAKELHEHAVAYINTDGSSTGFLTISGSHALETLAADVATRVNDPVTGVSVSERRRSVILVNGSADDKKAAESSPDLRMGALGSGSDYTPFLQHLGISSCDIRFVGHGEGGEYHTCFDTFDHFTTFVDPDFSYQVALANVVGRFTLRLLDADVVPFDFQRTAATFSRYVEEVVKLADIQRADTEAFNKLVAENRFALAADPAVPFIAPGPKEAVPYLNFAPLQNAVHRLTASAEACAKSLQTILDGETMLSPDTAIGLDRALFLAERELLAKDGLPRRPWYKHLVYAPGYYTGYGVKTLPGVREGIEERHWDEAQEQIDLAASALNRLADAIGTATEKISEK